MRLYKKNDTLYHSKNYNVVGFISLGYNKSTLYFDINGNYVRKYIIKTPSKDRLTTQTYYL